ncbi:MAG: HlyD family efflux transporter periplasmic adaptor subunit [Pseudomonadota bacterium]
MRFLGRSLIGLFLWAMTLGLLTWAVVVVSGAVQESLTQEERSFPARERVFAVNVQEISPQTIAPTLTVFGEVQSRRTLELRAVEGGRVIALDTAFEDGGIVTAGTELVRIDPFDADASLARARADLREAEAEERDANVSLNLAGDEVTAAQSQLDLRTRALQRQRDLQARGVGTEAAIETAELAEQAAQQTLLSQRQAVAAAQARLDQAAIQLERQRIALDEAERRVSETVVTAPFDGTLLDTALVVGGVVAENEQIAQLIDPNALEVAFRVSTGQYARLLNDRGSLIDAPIEAVLDVFGADIVVRGQVSRESGAVSEGQTGRLLFARLEPNAALRPGDFVTVRVREQELTRVALIPATAISGADTVLVLTDDERLEEQPVTVLRQQGDDTLIEAAALAGREVVTARTPLLGAGLKVRPMRNGAAPEPDMIELTEERRAKLMAFVENNDRMPDAAKERLLAQLQQSAVPARIVARLEQRLGG